MGGHVHDDGIDGPGAEAFSEELRQTIEELFEHEVTVKIYQNREKLDVHVEPFGLSRQLEAEYDGVNVVPYSDFKFTVSQS